jgi:hypothetical protein
MNRIYPLFLVVGLVATACGGDGPEGTVPGGSVGGGPGSGGGGGADCDDRFVEIVDGECVPVTVTGVVEEEVSFERGGHTLHGTLTLPVTAGTYRAPAAVLIHGSGPNDRDEHLPGSLGVPFPAPVAAFASLARQLTEAGIIVLRYDKRSCFAENNEHCTASVADYPGDVDAVTPTDFAEDARAAVQMVAERPEVREDDVLVMGHSQGGTFTPRLVHEEPAVSGGVGLASASLSLVDTLAGQLEFLADYLEAQNPTLFADDIAALRAEAESYRDAVAQIEDGTYPEPTFLYAPVAFWEDYIAWHDAHESDFLQNDKPLLLLSGDADFNIWPEHLETYEAWAAANEKTNVETWLAPGVTHALVPIVSGTPPLTHQIDPEVSPELVAQIRNWLAAQ